MAKKKKENVIYYDDGSTISDMSAVNRKGERRTPSQQPRVRSTFREKWKTYWDTVKMMIVPLCVMLIIIALLYFLTMWITGNFS